MKCRTDIVGKKIWIDNHNEFDTRPPQTDIVLYRDDVEYRRVTIDADGSGIYEFPCLIVWKDQKRKYAYRVDEPLVPDSYIKRIDGTNIINTLREMTINGRKTWVDGDDIEGLRPPSVTIRLFRNGTEISSQEVTSPIAPNNTVDFSFGSMPFADAQGNPYQYSLREDAVALYSPTIDGFNIINTLAGFFFSFVKKSERSQMSLADAMFEILEQGTVVARAASDANGNVAFRLPTGSFQLQEYQPPVGYMDDSTIYQVAVHADGTTTIDGVIAENFVVQNHPAFFVERATSSVSSYMAAPNCWPLNGGASPDLYMVERILITANILPVLVKWDYGVRDIAYFTSGGGYDITSSYNQGIGATNGDYTVYARLTNGFEDAITINVDRVRDGSSQMPYLLIDYDTAESLEPFINGIGEYTLEYMQGNGIKLMQSYEIFEDIDMAGRFWQPLGVTEGTMPIVIEGFCGSLCGNDNTIKNLSMGEGATPYDLLAFFAGVSDGAVIEKIRMENVEILGSGGASAFAAAISIYNGGSVRLSDLFFEARIENEFQGGGLINVADIYDGELIVDNVKCSDNTLINTQSYGAAMIAYCNIGQQGIVNITNCISSGEAHSAAGLAGIISWLLVHDGECNISNCANLMVLSDCSYQGGIVAMVQNVSEGVVKISSCYNGAAISGSSMTGGIVGGSACLQDSNLKIENCYNSADVLANDGICGGIIGMMSEGTLDKCYNVGRISLAEGSTTNEIGGLTGIYSIIQNSLSVGSGISSPQPFVARISPTADAPDPLLAGNAAFENMAVLINGVPKNPLDEGLDATDGLGVSALQIKNQNLYENTMGWDFSNIWDFGNQEYVLPILRSIPRDIQPKTLPPHLA